MTLTEIVLLLIIGLISGFASGILGVGGAIIIVPALVFIMGLTQHQAQGTSLAVLLFPIGILAAMNYYKAGLVNVKFVVILIAAFVVGGYFGSLLAVNIPAKTLKMIFGGITLLVSLKLLFGK